MSGGLSSRTPLIELQELTEQDRPITYGVVKPGPEDPEAGVLFIRGGDISNGSIQEEGLRTITQEVSRPYSRTLLRGGELVISLVGNPGEVALVPKRLAGANLARQAGLIALRPDVHAPYVKYYLMSPPGRAELFQRTQGAVQQVINLADLKKVKVRLPSRGVQEKVSEILSTYDNLIENNRKRIALLEESARLLYREWFVHLRFPGHEHVNVVDNVPKGWERRTLGTVCQSLEDGDWIETKDQSGSDYRLLQISNVGLNEFVETGNYRFVTEETYSRLNCRELLPGHILIARMPKPIGRAWLVHAMPWKMITAVDCAIAVANPKISDPHFLTYFINSAANLALCERRAVGATRPRITRREVASLPITVPPLRLQQQFRDFVEPIGRQQQLLRRQIDRLSEARDLLLPRLMSGEIAA